MGTGHAGIRATAFEDPRTSSMDRAGYAFGDDGAPNNGTSAARGNAHAIPSPRRDPEAARRRGQVGGSMLCVRVVGTSLATRERFIRQFRMGTAGSSSDLDAHYGRLDGRQRSQAGDAAAIAPAIASRCCGTPGRVRGAHGPIRGAYPGGPPARLSIGSKPSRRRSVRERTARPADASSVVLPTGLGTAASLAPGAGLATAWLDEVTLRGMDGAYHS